MSTYICALIALLVCHQTLPTFKCEMQKEKYNLEPMEYLQLLYSVLKDKPSAINGLYKQLEQERQIKDSKLKKYNNNRVTRDIAQQLMDFHNKEIELTLKYVNHTVDAYKKIVKIGCRPVPVRYDLHMLFQGYPRFTDIKRKLFLPPVIELNRCSSWSCHCMDTRIERCIPYRMKRRVLHVIVLDILEQFGGHDYHLLGPQVKPSVKDTKLMAELAINASIPGDKKIHYDNEMVVYDHEECRCVRFDRIKCPKPFDNYNCQKCDIQQARSMATALINAGLLQSSVNHYMKEHYFCDMIVNGRFSYGSLPLEYADIEIGIRNGTIFEPPCTYGYNILQSRCYRNDENNGY